MQQKTITQEDMDANPIIAQLDGQVGDKIGTALSDERQAEKDAADTEHVA